jgi:2-keto-4-pentenoate hydratase/2-oxohepta-3-ene-1,7-dioic acid hydratase in catechol pathway
MRLLSYEADDGEVRLAVGADGGGRNGGNGVEGDDCEALDVGLLLGEDDWTMDRLLADPEAGLARIRWAAADGRTAPRPPLQTLRLCPPVARPGKIVAVGRNYREHAAEESAALPEEPLVFAKLPSSMIGHGEPIRWSSRLTAQVDYEAELAVVIGRRARDVPADAALEHVLGYACLNDVSARDLQVRDGQWTRAKSVDSFCPIGPWVVTTDEIPDPGVLAIRCRVNGEIRQDASTAQLIHGVPELIAWLSRSFTLEPGDIIATGTPGGVGAFRDPPVFLGDGDVVEVEIERLGTLRNTCRVVD